MFDVQFTSAVVGISNLISNYAAQDLETQAIGPVVPFTYDVQSGDTLLEYDFITLSPNQFNTSDSQDFESLSIGVILSIPGNPLAAPFFGLDIFFNTGVITQVLNIGDDDLESYPVGNIPILNQSFSGGGDITMGVGFLRPYP
jgi:hypothetical protein